MKRLFPLTILIITAFNLFSQKVENVDFNFLDEKIIIFYDLVDCESKFLYEVSIKFIDDKGNTISPRILKGDFGIVPCGINKVAEWELFREVSQFDGNYKAIVTIERILDKLGRTISVKSDNLQGFTPHKFRRFDMGPYTNFYISGIYANLGFGFSIDYKAFYNKIALGIDLGYNLLEAGDLTIYLGVTPYLLNSEFFSFGLCIQPIPIVREETDEYYYKHYPRIGIYGGLELGRLKIMPSVGHHKTYKDYIQASSSQFNKLYFSITLKYRVN